MATRRRGTLHLADAPFRQDKGLALVRHEQAAVHMADGYARASGKPGVVLQTSGPGATNTVTGIWDSIHGLYPDGHSVGRCLPL